MLLAAVWLGTLHILLFLLLEAALVGIFYYWLFTFLLNRPVFIDCDKCGSRITTNTPWTCSCGYENINLNDYPFINRCEKETCHVEVKAYLCHHCELMGETKWIFLSQDWSQIHYAIATDPTRKRRQQEELEGQSRHMRRKEHELNVAKKQQEINDVKQGSAPLVKKDEVDEIEEMLRGTVNKKYGLDLAEIKLNREADEEHKDNEPERVKARLRIKDAVITVSHKYLHPPF